MRPHRRRPFGAVLAGGLRRRALGSVERDPALDSATAVAPVGLDSLGHPGRYGSPRPWTSLSSSESTSAGRRSSLASSTGTGTCLAASRREPEGSEASVLAALEQSIEALLDERVGAIGLGVPANLDRETRTVLRATNLPLDDFDLAGPCMRASGFPPGSRTTRARPRSPSGSWEPAGECRTSWC